jgi:hypothetical protein
MTGINTPARNVCVVMIFMSILLYDQKLGEPKKIDYDDLEGNLRGSYKKIKVKLNKAKQFLEMLVKWSDN